MNKRDVLKLVKYNMLAKDSTLKSTPPFERVLPSQRVVLFSEWCKYEREHNPEYYYG